MERVTQEKLYDQLLCPDLSGEAAQSSFVLVRRYAYGQLLAKLLSQFLLEAERGLIVNLAVTSGKAQRAEKLILGKLRHPN